MTTIHTLYRNIANAITSYFARRSARIEHRQALLALENEYRTKRAKAGIEIANAQIEIAALLSEMAAARKTTLRKSPSGGIVHEPGGEPGPFLTEHDWINRRMRFDDPAPDLTKAAETWRKLNSNPAAKSKRDRVDEVFKWANESETPILHSEVIEKIRAILDEDPTM